MLSFLKRMKSVWVRWQLKRSPLRQIKKKRTGVIGSIKLINWIVKKIECKDWISVNPVGVYPR